MPVKLSTDESVSHAAVEHGNRSTAKVELSGVEPSYTCPMHPEIQGPSGQLPEVRDACATPNPLTHPTNTGSDRE